MRDELHKILPASAAECYCPDDTRRSGYAVVVSAAISTIPARPGLICRDQAGTSTEEGQAAFGTSYEEKRKNAVSKPNDEKTDRPFCVRRKQRNNDYGKQTRPDRKKPGFDIKGHLNFHHCSSDYFAVFSPSRRPGISAHE